MNRGLTRTTWTLRLIVPGALAGMILSLVSSYYKFGYPLNSSYFRHILRRDYDLLIARTLTLMGAGVVIGGFTGLLVNRLLRRIE
jgi:hypothetical protein